MNNKIIILCLFVSILFGSIDKKKYSANSLLIISDKVFKNTTIYYMDIDETILERKRSHKRRRVVRKPRKGRSS